VFKRKKTNEKKAKEKGGSLVVFYDPIWKEPKRMGGWGNKNPLEAPNTHPWLQDKKRTKGGGFQLSRGGVSQMTKQS